MLSKDISAKIISMIAEKGEVHYSDIAVGLGVSIPTAHRYAIIFSKMYSKNVKYERGRLILTNEFDQYSLDIRTRFKALQNSYQTLLSKVQNAREQLTALLENDFEHLSREELKQKLIKIVQRL